MNLLSESFLIHHGIKGQKWGVRNGPPYPLDDSQNRRAAHHRNLIERGRAFVSSNMHRIKYRPLSDIYNGFDDDEDELEKLTIDDILSLPKAQSRLKMSSQTYGHVMHEIMTNISSEQRFTETSFVKNVGQYSYAVSNDLEGGFGLMGRVKISELMKHYGNKNRGK